MVSPVVSCTCVPYGESGDMCHVKPSSEKACADTVELTPERGGGVDEWATTDGMMGWNGRRKGHSVVPIDKQIVTCELGEKKKPH